MRFGTYNLRALGRADSRAEQDRQALVHAVIRGLRVDILAVQEVHATAPEEAAARLVELAEQVGMTAYHHAPAAGAVSAERVAVGISPHALHLGLLWDSERVACVPGSFRSYHQDGMHHGLIRAVFEVPGSDGTTHLVQHGCVHLTPFGPHGGRADEAVRVVTAFTRPLSRPPGLVGGDWNTVTADRTAGGGFYDHDPYASRPWHSACVYQCRWSYDEHGKRVGWHADRTPGDALYAGGLLDATVVLHNATAAEGGVPWQATTGHRSSTVAFGPRRICGIRVTTDVEPALRRVDTADHSYFIAAGMPEIDPALASDHLPVVVTYDPAGTRPEAQR